MNSGFFRLVLYTEWQCRSCHIGILLLGAPPRAGWRRNIKQNKTWRELEITGVIIGNGKQNSPRMLGRKNHLMPMMVFD